MFHRYALAASGKTVDVDRAAYLMDDDLRAQADELMRKEMTENPGSDADHRMQRLWDTYCALHRQTYGEPFQPDVDPDWDT